MVKIKIEQDDDVTSPREWNNLGTFVLCHRRYNFGDKNYHYGVSNIDELYLSENINREVAKNQIVLLPVYLYEHSGLALSTKDFGDRFDSGQCGFIYATYEKIRKNFQYKRVTKKLLSLVKECLEQEIKTMDNFLQGNVWWYCIETSEGEHIDSCGGFFGKTLEETGMLDHVDKKYRAELKLAWSSSGE